MRKGVPSSAKVGVGGGRRKKMDNQEKKAETSAPKPAKNDARILPNIVFLLPCWVRVLQCPMPGGSFNVETLPLGRTERPYR
jgi:hypothetical protein